MIFPGQSSADAIYATENTPEVMQSWPEILKILFTWAQGLWLWRSASAYSTDSRLSGLGFFWLLGCVPSILFLLRRSITRSSFCSKRYLFLVLVTIVGIAFIGTPLRWWARYTLWIYALGLPCFAVVLECVLRRRARKLAYLWVMLCFAVLFFESVMSMYRVSCSESVRKLCKEPALLFDRQTWVKPPHSHLNGTWFDKVFEEDAAVAVGPLGETHIVLLGYLSYPVGRLNWVSIPQDPDINEMRAQGIRYVIWDTETPIPEVLREIVLRMDEYHGMYLIVLMDEFGG